MLVRVPFFYYYSYTAGKLKNITEWFLSSFFKLYHFDLFISETNSDEITH